jgi:hypothetical protein
MFWFVLCYVLFATRAASRRVDAFVFSSTNNNNNNNNKNQQNGRTRTTSFPLHETTSAADAATATADATASTKSATPTVDFDSVVRCIDELYPPKGLDQRIALSRKDGYWPFISAGEDPPQELVYGEFDVSLLEQSLQRSLELL